MLIFSGVDLVISAAIVEPADAQAAAALRSGAWPEGLFQTKPHRETALTKAGLQVLKRGRVENTKRRSRAELPAEPHAGPEELGQELLLPKPALAVSPL
jgi:hypothetical protein